MMEKAHPTATKLMDTVSTMLDSSHPHDIIVDDILKKSGVSRSSLYHHFGDFSGLIQDTLLRRFSANVDADGQAMMTVAEASTSKEDYWRRIRELSSYTQLPSRAPVRAERSRMISMASSDPDFQKALSREQDRVTQTMAKAIAVAQGKGWVTQELSAQAVAVFLQAYSLGRAVDDIAGDKVPNEEWVLLVEKVLGTFES